MTIVLPDEIYRSLPPAGEGAHTATEAQIEAVEEYGLHLAWGARRGLLARVNICRFSARASCTLLPESRAGA